MKYHAIMAVDPGTHTGVAWAVLGGTGTIHQRLGAALYEVSSRTLTGGYCQQADALLSIYQDFEDRVYSALGRRRYEDKTIVDVVIEDYILTRFDSSDREGLDPVRVTSAFTYWLSRHQIPWSLQQASDAMGCATNDRLRRWGVWVPGSQREHERDARRHLLLCAARDILRNTEGKQKKGKGLSGS